MDATADETTDGFTDAGAASESVKVTGFKASLTAQALADYEAASMDERALMEDGWGYNSTMAGLRTTDDSATELGIQGEQRRSAWDRVRETAAARIDARQGSSYATPSPRTSALSNVSAARGKGRFKRKPMQQLFTVTARDFNLRTRRPDQVQPLVETDLSDGSSISLYAPKRE